MANDGIMQYFAKLGLDASEFLSGISRSQAGILQFARDSTVAMAGVTAAVYAAYAAVQKYGSMADEINDLAYTTGMSTEKIQQLQYAATLSGTQFGSVTQGINQFSLSIAKAGDTSSEAGKAFAEMGISTDGRSYDQLFEDTAYALVDMEDETRRNEMAMTLYGRSWKELLPFMQTYIEKAAEIKANPFLTESELRDLEEAKISLDALASRATILSGKGLADLENAFKRAANGADILSAAQTLNIDKMRIALGAARDLAEAERIAAREDWEANNKEILDKSGSGVNWDYYNGQMRNQKQALATQTPDPLAGLTGEDADIALLRDYKIPALKEAYTDLAASGTASKLQLAEASHAVIDAEEELVRLTSEEVTVQEDLTSATDDLADAQSRLNDINKDYAREMSILNPRDVSAARQLTIRHNWAVEDQQDEIAKAQGIVAEAAAPIDALTAQYDGTEIGMTVTVDTATAEAQIQQFIANPLNPTASPGITGPAAADITPLPSPFISQSMAAGADVATPDKFTMPQMTLPTGDKYGDVIVNIDGKTLTKVPGVAAGGNNLTPDALAARGVRVG